jgi:hypothetical protein
MNPVELWAFLPIGYVTTVLIEMPILWFGLAGHYSARQRIVAGLWLTACTYPIVVLVLPMIISLSESRPLYLLVAETFAPIADCALVGWAFGRPEKVWSRSREAWPSMVRDCLAIVAANLASFLLGEVISRWGY